MITIGTMMYLIEFKNAKGWLSRFFDVFGKNALFVFALSAFIPKGLRLIHLYQYNGENGKPVQVDPWSWLYHAVLRYIPGPPENGSLAFAICVILFMWFICWWMDKKKLYVKV